MPNPRPDYAAIEERMDECMRQATAGGAEPETVILIEPSPDAPAVREWLTKKPA